MSDKDKDSSNTRQMSRREFLKTAGLLGAAYWLGPKLMLGGRAYAHQGFNLLSPLPGGTLDAAQIPKYRMPLVIPPAMPRKGRITGPDGKLVDYYEIAVRQFRQQILPPTDVNDDPLNPTTVWSYGASHRPGSFNYPAFTIEARMQRPVRVKWINELVDEQGNFLPHLLPVDPTLHWANPPQGSDPAVYGEGPRDSRPVFTSTPGSYTGPVPIVTHLHGAVRVGDESDGFAEAWFLPTANNIPTEYATVGTWYNTFKAKAESKFGVTWEPGTAVFQYPNNHRAATLWYHDHTLGMTRLNVYAGPAGFYLLRGGTGDRAFDAVTRKRAILPGPAPALDDPPGTKYYEIPIVVQDRSFNTDGSLFYPDSRAFFGDVPPEGPFIPETDVPPIWNPEFFGTTMVVNGRTWPYLEVEQRRYRFRFLNGCNSRFLILQFDQTDWPAGLNFWQIGNEGGFLLDPVELPQLLMGPAERADIIVDFTNIPIGTTIKLLNLGPDAPFGGLPIAPEELADPASTGQVMEFRVVAATSTDTSTPPNRLVLPPIAQIVTRSRRSLALLEKPSAFFDAPVAALLGTFTPRAGVATEREWEDPITENPRVGTAEVWELYNLTVDAHPIHVHEVAFQVLNRQALDPSTNLPTGTPRRPEPWETGFKDTVIAYPGEVTRVRIRFDVAGLFVWHCHIVEHEDNEMMRPYAIGPIPTPLP